ncbi:MAG: YIP1 family protein [Verrucomicrobiota bacterium]
MEEPSAPQILENPPATPSSVIARLTNVFVAPGEVFDEVKTSKPTPANWIVPMILSMIVGIVYTLIVFSQPAITQRIQQAQEKKFDEMVASGKMTRAQADQTLATVEKFMGPGFLKISGSVGAVFFTAALLFFTALIFWVIGRRALGGNFTYMKAVEAVGLSCIINILGTLISMMLAVIYGNIMMTFGPALLVSHFDATNGIHRALSVLNGPSLWYVTILSIALSRFTGASFGKEALWLFGIWALLAVVPVVALAAR